MKKLKEVKAYNKALKGLRTYAEAGSVAYARRWYFRAEELTKGDIKQKGHLDELLCNAYKNEIEQCIHILCDGLRSGKSDHNLAFLLQEDLYTLPEGFNPELKKQYLDWLNMWKSKHLDVKLFC